MRRELHAADFSASDLGILKSLNSMGGKVIASYSVIVFVSVLICVSSLLV